MDKRIGFQQVLVRVRPVTHRLALARVAVMNAPAARDDSAPVGAACTRQSSPACCCGYAAATQCPTLSSEKKNTTQSETMKNKPFNLTTPEQFLTVTAGETV